MSFKEVTKIAYELGIPDFAVLELDKYKKLARNYNEPEHAIIYIPWKNEPNKGHYVSCFRESNGILNYQDSFGNKNEFPMNDINRKFKINKVKYQSYFSNNCGYLALLHLFTHDKLDPLIKRL